MADASALVEYLFRTDRAEAVDALVADPDADFHVPALCDVEVAAFFRRALHAGVVSEERTGHALEDYLDLPITRHGHRALIPRVLALRANFSAYDATYVALAEELSAALVTADDRLARAVRAHTRIPAI